MPAVHSALMDEPSTEPAASQDTTQGVYAWSDDETGVWERRRSWKLPIALTVLTAAAAIAGVVELWPRPATPPPAAAKPSPTTTAPTIDPVNVDAAFINLYHQRGYQESTPGQTPALIFTAHQVCMARSSGEPATDLIADFVKDNATNTPPATQGQAQVFVNTAIDAMCPQYR